MELWNDNVACFDDLITILLKFWKLIIHWIMSVNECFGGKLFKKNYAYKVAILNL